MTMPKFEPVAWRYELKAGEYTFAEKRYLNETYAPRPTALHPADQLTEAYEAGKLEQAAQIEMMRQQLASAIAACKLKDEALLLAAETYNSVWESHMPIIDTEMDKALTIQPDDSALKAWVSQRIASTFRKMK